MVSNLINIQDKR